MDPRPTSSAIAAGVIGNVLEWYDFAIYGYFAASIGRSFFPHEDSVAQLLAAFGVFALGYLVRPIGGALIGHIGDYYGRRAALTVSVTAMAVPTFLIGLLPGYETLGLLAPLALILLRMVQGLSVGGEYTSSIVFLVERASAGYRGLMGAVSCCGTTLGIMLGSGVGATIAALTTTETLDGWGWRIPFLLGLVLGVVGFILRRHVIEASPVERSERSPIVETLRDHWRLVVRLAALSVFNAVSFYAMFVYVASWLQTADGISPAHALEINTTSMFVLLPNSLGLGMAVGSLRSQSDPDAVDGDRGRRCPAAIMGDVSPFAGVDPARTNGLRFNHRSVWRNTGDGDGGSHAAANSLYRGSAWLQCLRWRDRRVHSARGGLAGGAYRG